jgi:hypothetical protein
VAAADPSTHEGSGPERGCDRDDAGESCDLAILSSVSAKPIAWSLMFGDEMSAALVRIGSAAADSDSATVAALSPLGSVTIAFKDALSDVDIWNTSAATAQSSRGGVACRTTKTAATAIQTATTPATVSDSQTFLLMNGDGS